jgi:tRNA nucleotidyltransferase (CCA-adding enzyme)
MTTVPGKSYVVGGAVRDRLLGLPVSDRDHVVVGATVDEMKAAGFKPVGRDFPVFLHPESHEEYALARTERKVAPGYAGFVFHADPSVPLEADLERRDLTINAMAEDDAGGRLVDPFGGRRDLDARVFRHVGPAFVEDPVRILRVARFAARFPDFGVATETMALMRSMVRDGEVDALVPERVWQEFSRGLMERRPVRMLDLLREVGALERLLPELTALPEAGWREATVALESAAFEGAALAIRFAVLIRIVDGIERVCARFGVPRALRELALLVAREVEPLRTVATATSSAQVGERLTGILERSDAFRRRTRFDDAIRAIGLTIADRAARTVFETRIAAALTAAMAIDAGAIARAAGPEPASIARALHEARKASLERTW